jgi:hypothetical protein
MRVIDDDGTTGPYQSFIHKNGRSMVAYAQALRTLGIVGEAAAPLLAATDEDGMSATFAALFRGGAGQWLKDFAQAHLCVGLTGKAALPSMRVTSGNHNYEWTSVYIALEKDDTDSVKDFAAALDSLGIRGHMAKPLFKATDSDGHTWFDDESEQGIFDESTERVYRAAQRQLGIL